MMGEGTYALRADDRIDEMEIDSLLEGIDSSKVGGLVRFDDKPEVLEEQSRLVSGAGDAEAIQLIYQQRGVRFHFPLLTKPFDTRDIVIQIGEGSF
jgi:hypothetical protein